MISHASSSRTGRGHDLPDPSRTLVVHLRAPRPRPTAVDIYAGTAALISFSDARARRLITLTHEAKK